MFFHCQVVLMYVDISGANFATKPCLWTKFFVRENSLQLNCTRKSLLGKFTISKQGFVLKFAGQRKHA